MTYPEALAWLDRARRSGIKLGLENTRHLLRALGDPQEGMRFLHVAGTNGKGSVCAFLAAALRAHGLRVGLYTSPHLVTFRERIRVDENPISERDTTAGVARLQRLAAELDPTCFELITTLALDHFRREGCGVVVLETGLGGRLDSTNVVTPLACGITRIDLDHRAWLGDTLAEIAAEKAGIIKPGTPVVSVPQSPQAGCVLRRVARERNAPFTLLAPPYRARELRLIGAHQQENAALAAAVLENAGLRIPPDTLEPALAAAEWPGRFQIFADEIVLDGAHNPAAAAALAAAWVARFGDEKAALVFGAMRDKDISGLWHALRPIASALFVVAGDGDRWMPPGALLELLPGAGGRVAGSIPEALRLARATGHRTLVTGSLFLVGATLSFLTGTRQDWPGV